MLTVFRFCNALRFGGAFLVLYFAGISGSYTLAMSVFSITSLTQLVVDIPLGFLSDRFGRRPTIVLGAIVSLAVTLAYGSSRTYVVLALGAALEGLARALFSGTEAALLYESLAEEGMAGQYVTYRGRVSAAEPVAFALAGLVGGVIAAIWSFRVAFWLTLLPQMVALGAAVQLREPAAARPHTAHPSVRAAIRPFLHNTRLQLLVGAAAWREAWSEPAFQFRPAFFQTLWPVWALGVALTISDVLAALGFWSSGRVIARLGAVRALVADIVVGRILNLAALLLPSVASPALMSFTSLTYGVSEVASDALQQQEFSDRERATMGSISSQAVGVAFALGTIVIGVLADALGTVRVLVLAQILLLPTIVPYRVLFAHNARGATTTG